MSGFALLRAIVLFVIGLAFIYAGVFNPQMMYEGASSPPATSESNSRLIELGLGAASVLFSLWIIRRQLRAAVPLSEFGASGKVVLGVAGVVGLALVGYIAWHNAHQTYVQPNRHDHLASPANSSGRSPAPAPAPPPPAGAAGAEPAPAPGPLPAAVPQAGSPAPAPAPLSPTGD